MKLSQLSILVPAALLVLGCGGDDEPAQREEPQPNAFQTMEFDRALDDLKRVVATQGIKAVPVELMSPYLVDTAMTLGQDLCEVPERLRHDERVVQLYIAHNATPKTDCMPDEFRGRPEARALPVSFRDALIPRDSLTVLERSGLIIEQVSDQWSGRRQYQIVGVSSLQAAQTFNRITDLEQGLDRRFEGGRMSGVEDGNADGERLIYAIQGLSGSIAEALRRSLDNLPTPIKRQVVRWGVELYARYDRDGHYAKQYVLPFSWQFVNQLPDRSAAFERDSTLEDAYWAGRTVPIQVERVRVTHDQWVTLEWMKRRGPVTYNLIREELQRQFGS